MAKNGVQTGKTIASTSSKLLRSDKSSKETKKVSGSALSNAKSDTKVKRK